MSLLSPSLGRSLNAVGLSADLHVEIGRDDAAPVRAHLTGAANRLTLEVDDPGAFAGAADAPALRQVADGLATIGVQLRVESGGQHLITMGDVRAPWWHRRVTRSRRIRLGSARGLYTAARGRARRTSSILPGAELAPPGTVWPLFPTFQLHSRRPTATTHATLGAGGPRLVVAWDYVMGDERPPTYWLGETTVIGSAEDCDVVLPGLAPRHVVIDHSREDEYVVTSAELPSSVHGAGATGQILRTGARLEVGGHVLVFYREEYADHGRPFGGRIGGEAGRQLAQPSREELVARAYGEGHAPPGTGPETGPDADGRQDAPTER